MPRLSWLLALCLLTGCVGLAGIRNGPARPRLRAKTTVTNDEWVGVNQRRLTYVREADVEDKSRPLGAGIGGKTGYAHGGSTTSHGGYAQDFNAYLVYAFGRFYVAPQLAFTMNLHGSDVMGRAQTAIMVPIELEAGVRVSSKTALFASAGRSLWGKVSDADLSSDQTFYRGRGGLLLVVREGDFDRKEITLRLEGFAISGNGDTLDYSAVGGLLSFDFVFTSSGRI
jgi:hypothetical protein